MLREVQEGSRRIKKDIKKTLLPKREIRGTIITYSIKDKFIMVRPTFEVHEFQTGRNLNVDSKKYIFEAMARRCGGWDCALSMHENCVATGKSTSTNGLTEIIRGCLDQKSQSVWAGLKYDGDHEQVIAYLVGMIAPQWHRRFPDIYALMTGKRINSYVKNQIHQSQFDFGAINEALNVKSTKSIKTKKTTKKITDYSPKTLTTVAEIKTLIEKCGSEKNEVLECLRDL
tara:strand:+ start:59 stop:745 length:687 start_codon:yes stop_codon:yes gene_type:complete